MIFKKIHGFFLAASVAIFMSGCATTLDSKLLQKPAAETKAVKIIYINMPMGGDRKDPYDLLNMLGYSKVGDVVKKVGPPVFIKRGLSAEAINMDYAEFKKTKFGNQYDEKSLSQVESPNLLMVNFLGASLNRNGGAGGDLGLKATFTDPEGKQIYWKGEYLVIVKKTFFAGAGLDESTMGKVLTKIAADMEKVGLLNPEVKP